MFVPKAVKQKENGHPRTFQPQANLLDEAIVKLLLFYSTLCSLSILFEGPMSKMMKIV